MTVRFKTLEDIAAGFAARNAAKVAKMPVQPAVKVCLACACELPGVTCWKDREGPYCFECWLEA